MEHNLDKLIQEFIAWEKMVDSGVGPDGDPVQIDGRLVVELRPRMLAEIGGAAVAAHLKGGR